MIQCSPRHLGTDRARWERAWIGSPRLPRAEHFPHVEPHMKIVGGCLAAVLATTSGWARADVAVLVASRDNTLYQDLTGSVSSGVGPTMFCGETNVGNLHRALVRFDLSSIPAGSTLTSVQLGLHLSRTISGDVDVSIYRSLKDWGEGTSDAGFNGGRGAPATPGDATWGHTFFDAQLWTVPGGAPDLDYVSTPSATSQVGFDFLYYTWGSTPAIDRKSVV